MPEPPKLESRRSGPARVRLGELLVDAQLISREQLDLVLELQKRDPRRLGALIVEQGFASESQVTQILSHQLSVPWVSLYRVEFSRELLDIVSSELARRHGLIPIFTRRVRGKGKVLYIAMEDPSDEAAQREVSASSGHAVRAMIAPPSEIRSALYAYYTSGRSTAAFLADAVDELEPAEFLRAVPQAALSERSRSATGAGPGVSGINLAVQSTGSEHEVEFEDVVVAFRETKPDRLPARPPVPERDSNPGLPPEAHSDSPSAELLTLLRGRLQSALPAELLGQPVSWEALLDAALSLLIRKQISLDSEFFEEYRRRRR